MIDYSTFPLDVLQKALADLRRMFDEGFPIDRNLIIDVQIAVIDRKTEHTPADPDIDNGDLADA